MVIKTEMRIDNNSIGTNLTVSCHEDSGTVEVMFNNDYDKRFHLTRQETLDLIQALNNTLQLDYIT